MNGVKEVVSSSILGLVAANNQSLSTSDYWSLAVGVPTGLALGAAYLVVNYKWIPLYEKLKVYQKALQAAQKKHPKVSGFLEKAGGIPKVPDCWMDVVGIRGLFVGKHLRLASESCQNLIRSSIRLCPESNETFAKNKIWVNFEAERGPKVIILNSEGVEVFQRFFKDKRSQGPCEIPHLETEHTGLDSSGLGLGQR